MELYIQLIQLEALQHWNLLRPKQHENQLIQIQLELHQIMYCYKGEHLHHESSSKQLFEPDKYFLSLSHNNNTQFDNLKDRQDQRLMLPHPAMFQFQQMQTHTFCLL